MGHPWPRMRTLVTWMEKRSFFVWGFLSVHLELFLAEATLFYVAAYSFIILYLFNIYGTCICRELEAQKKVKVSTFKGLTGFSSL